MPAKHTQQREATDPVEPHPPAEAAERTPVLEESEVTAKATATQPNSKQEPATNQQVASALIESEPCISPEEQKRNLGKGEPKRKGRPPKNPSAAAKAKAKAKSQAKKASKPTAKAKAKASAGAKKTHASKADSPAPSVAPEDEPDITAGSSSDANAKPASNRTKKPRTSKEEGDAKPTPSSKPQAKSRSAKPTKKDNKNTKCKDDKKALLSRKSCAYKKARREALQSGKTPEEANSAAKKATSSITKTMSVCFPILDVWDTKDGEFGRVLKHFASAIGMNELIALRHTLRPSDAISTLPVKCHMGCMFHALAKPVLKQA